MAPKIGDKCSQETVLPDIEDLLSGPVSREGFPEQEPEDIPTSLYNPEPKPQDEDPVFKMPCVFVQPEQPGDPTIMEQLEVCEWQTGIGPNSSPIAFLLGKEAPEGFAEILAGGEGMSGLDEDTAKAFTEYYLLHQIATGQIVLNEAEKQYLKTLAATRMEQGYIAVKEGFAMAIVADQNAWNASFDPNDPFGVQRMFAPPASPEEQITKQFEQMGKVNSDPFAGVFSKDFFNTKPTDKKDIELLGQAFIDGVTLTLTGDTGYDFALAMALERSRSKLVDVLRKKASTSWNDHTKEIDELAKIGDPILLAAGIEKLNVRLEREKKLQPLADAMSDVGHGAWIAGKYVSIDEKIQALVDVPEGEPLDAGIKEFVLLLNDVALSNALGQMLQMAEGLEGSVKEISVAGSDEPRSLAMSMMCAGPGTRSACAINELRDSGREHRLQYGAYFKRTIPNIKEARRLVSIGDMEGARKIFNETLDQKEFQAIAEGIQGDLKLTEGYNFAINIGIIIAAGAVGGVVGAYAAAGASALGAPVWVVGLSSLVGETTGFMAASKTMSYVAFDQSLVDPKKNLVEEFIETALMFKFLRLGMNGYNKVVNNFLFRRATSELLATGAITEAMVVKMAPETASKIAARAELKLFGKIMNFGGAFAAEYKTFTAWDYLKQTYEASKEAGELTLPENFFTSASFAERFKFLACLKMGGALAHPFTSPLMAKASANLLGKFEPRFKQYDAEYKGLMDELGRYQKDGVPNDAKLSDLLGRMEKCLGKRQKLEASLATINPALAQSAALTRSVLDNLKTMASDARQMEVISRGEYTSAESRSLEKFLATGKEKGLLDFTKDADGVIRVSFKGDKPQTVEVRPAKSSSKNSDGPGAGLSGSGRSSDIWTGVRTFFTEDVPFAVDYLLNGAGGIIAPFYGFSSFSSDWSGGGTDGTVTPRGGSGKPLFGGEPARENVPAGQRPVLAGDRVEVSWVIKNTSGFGAIKPGGSQMGFDNGSFFFGATPKGLFLECGKSGDVVVIMGADGKTTTYPVGKDTTIITIKNGDRIVATRNGGKDVVLNTEAKAIVERPSPSLPVKPELIMDPSGKLGRVKGEVGDVVTIEAGGGIAKIPINEGSNVKGVPVPKGARVTVRRGDKIVLEQTVGPESTPRPPVSENTKDIKSPDLRNFSFPREQDPFPSRPPEIDQNPTGIFPILKPEDIPVKTKAEEPARPSLYPRARENIVPGKKPVLVDSEPEVNPAVSPTMQFGTSNGEMKNTRTKKAKAPAVLKGEPVPRSNASWYPNSKDALGYLDNFVREEGELYKYVFKAFGQNLSHSEFVWGNIQSVLAGDMNLNSVTRDYGLRGIVEKIMTDRIGALKKLSAKNKEPWPAEPFPSLEAEYAFALQRDWELRPGSAKATAIKSREKPKIRPML